MRSTLEWWWNTFQPRGQDLYTVPSRGASFCLGLKKTYD